MEDYHVAKFVQFHGRELGLFAIYDGHLGDSVPAYLQKHLFSNILKEVSCPVKWLVIWLMIVNIWLYTTRKNGISDTPIVTNMKNYHQVLH